MELLREGINEESESSQVSSLGGPTEMEEDSQSQGHAESEMPEEHAREAVEQVRKRGLELAVRMENYSQQSCTRRAGYQGGKTAGTRKLGGKWC